MNCSSKTLFLFHNISFKVYFFCLSISLLYYIFSLSFFSKIYLNISQIKPNCVLFFVAITFPFPFSLPLRRHRIKKGSDGDKKYARSFVSSISKFYLVKYSEKEEIYNIIVSCFLHRNLQFFLQKNLLSYFLSYCIKYIYLSIYLYIFFLVTYFLIYLIFLRSNNIPT